MFCRRKLIFFDFKGDFKGGTSKRGKKICIQSKNNQDIETKLPDAKQTFNDDLGDSQVQKRRLGCDAMHQCAHSQDELPSVSRGVITQTHKHLRCQRGSLEDAFGSSGTTGGIQPRHRYALPPESQFFSIFGVGGTKKAKNFR
jgi:hypothetical protein